MNQPIDLAPVLSLAIDCARNAGELLRQYYAKPIKTQIKSALEVVTEADHASEALIVSAITARYPDHHIIGEEGGGMGAPRTESSYCWHIDPVDGTSNFARKIPNFCVSIGLAGPDGVPLVGAVYAPMTDELYTSIRGHGAMLNGQPIHVSKVNRLDRALLASGFPGDRHENIDNNTEEFTQMIERAQGVRCLGSAALELCYVAAGRFDGYWHKRVKSWDVMAALACLVEAGGMISNYRGGQDGVYHGQEIVVSNGLIHDAILTVLVLGKDAPRPKKRTLSLP